MHFIRSTSEYFEIKRYSMSKFERWRNKLLKPVWLTKSPTDSLNGLYDAVPLLFEKVELLLVTWFKQIVYYLKHPLTVIPLVLFTVKTYFFKTIQKCLKVFLMNFMNINHPMQYRIILNKL